MDTARLTQLLEGQAGVVSRKQVLALGGDDVFIERQLRRREWCRVHRGIFVDHTGELPWVQRAWAAVLYYWPAALSHESALDVHGLRTTGQRGDRIHVSVGRDRRVGPVNGVRVHRVMNLPDLVQPNRSPARVRLEHALVTVASRAKSDSDAIAVLADACQCGRTTPARLVEALRQHPNLPRRRFLLEVLDDVAEGAYSVLEHRYLTRVERPHGLPTARRQRRVRPGRTPAYRDVEYLALATVVELDGRWGHEETLDRWDDMDPDVDSAVQGDLTVRVGWRHVADPCRTAGAVGRILGARGWQGRLRPCSATCSLQQGRGGYSAPGAGTAPQPGTVERAG
jgi:hypothetical protein